MKSLILPLIVGVILFAISASASWYLMNQKPPETAEVAEPTIESEAGVPDLAGTKPKPEQMPVALRPEVPLTVEAVLELSESIHRKERELIDREKRAEKTEQNVQLLFEDLKVERAELTALAEKIEARLKQAQMSVADLKVENQTLATQTQELAKLQKKQETQAPGAEDAADEIGQRVKTAKPWFEGLEESQAANYLKEFANNGDLQFAARLLKSLPQRKAAKILAAFNDPDFVQQILNALSAKEQAGGDGVAQQRSSAGLR